MIERIGHLDHPVVAAQHQPEAALLGQDGFPEEGPITPAPRSETLVEPHNGPHQDTIHACGATLDGHVQAPSH